MVVLAEALWVGKADPKFMSILVRMSVFPSTMEEAQCNQQATQMTGWSVWGMVPY